MAIIFKTLLYLLVLFHILKLGLLTNWRNKSFSTIFRKGTSLGSSQNNRWMSSSPNISIQMWYLCKEWSLLRERDLWRHKQHIHEYIQISLSSSYTHSEINKLWKDKQNMSYYLCKHQITQDRSADQRHGRDNPPVLPTYIKFYHRTIQSFLTKY